MKRLSIYILILFAAIRAFSASIYVPGTNDYLYHVILGLYSNDLKLNTIGGVFPTKATTNLDMNWNIISNSFFKGDGSGLTNLSASSESDPIFADWLATNTYVEAESDPVWTAASGAVTSNWRTAKLIAIGADQTQTIDRAWGPDGYININTGGVTLALNFAADWLDANGYGDVLINYYGTNSLTLVATNTGALRGWPVSLTNANGQIFIQKYQGTMTPCVTVFQ